MTCWQRRVVLGAVAVIAGLGAALCAMWRDGRAYWGHP